MHLKIIYLKDNKAEPGLQRCHFLSCYVPFFYPPLLDRSDEFGQAVAHKRAVEIWEKSTGNKAIFWQPF